MGCAPGGTACPSSSRATTGYASRKYGGGWVACRISASCAG
ncbi:MAG: hypothetical protein U0521_16290 [Anaerolineae bacterium]